MQPVIMTHFSAIIAGVVASFFFGMLWHTALFGKLWAKLMKIPEGTKPESSAMLKSMLIGIVGTLLMTCVLQYTLDVWRPSSWGVGSDQPFYYYGFMNGFFTWIGFFVPMFLASVAWEGRSWKLFGFNISYHFINLQIISMILAWMH